MTQLRDALRRQRPHSLDSEYVREQLEQRTRAMNDQPLRRGGEYVLCWLQSAQRLEENWTVRAATRHADEIGLPLIIYQGLDPTYPFASERIHTFILEGARDTARRARELGYTYAFHLRARPRDDGRVVDRLAARAALVVTDDYPAAGVGERTTRVAARVGCTVLAVDSAAVVPMSFFPRAQGAARTMRPRLLELLPESIERVDDRPPRRETPAWLAASLPLEPVDLERINVGALVASCEIDHGVTAVDTRGGTVVARERLREFVERSAARYHTGRRDPTRGDSSRLSPYLHFGHIAPVEVVRHVAMQIDGEALHSFLDQIIVWRELALNLCARTSRVTSTTAIPAWARRSLAEHEHERSTPFTLAQLERAETDSPLWNAAQRELLASGTIHNAMRQLWGKSVVLWTRQARESLKRLVYLNDRYALDGRDPNGYANILWCFGKFDRPFPRRPGWGLVRPMVLERASTRFDVDAYIARWTASENPVEPILATA
jgi:photolyase PhrII